MTDAPFSPEEVARYEKATWSRCAETYVEGFGALVAEAIVPLLDAAAISPGQCVLDVGTGPGLVAAAAAERGADVIGIDFSEPMLAKARSLCTGIAFQRADAESLPFEAASFDAVVGNFVLHHSGRPDRVLEEAFRVLRDGAKTAFTVWSSLEKLEAFGLFMDAVAAEASESELPHGPLFGVSDFDVFRQMMKDDGFRDATVSELPIAWRTRSIETMLGSLSDWADLSTVPLAARERIETTVREGAERYRSGNTFIMPNPAILIAATK
ncbi:MAG TPA: methyltransferase domain-containing protein [Steroidobacteraceae bacterium]|nr:methyltransferase domain-containing protein [Steroidobacteraceae bacterium]